MVTGGEPTLQQDLPEFLQRIKSLGFLVKLDTNGSKPAVVKRVLQAGLVDMVAIDVKTSLFNEEAYDRVCGAAVPLPAVRECIAFVAKSGIDRLHAAPFLSEIVLNKEVVCVRQRY